MTPLAELHAHRRAFLWLLVALFSLAAVFGLTRLEFDDVLRGFFRSDDRAFLLLEEIMDRFGSDDDECYLLVETEELFTPESIAELRALAARVRAIEGIDRVRGLLDMPFAPREGAGPEALMRARRIAFENPLVAGHLLSRDGQATVLAARIAGGALSMAHIRPVRAALAAAAAETSASTPLRVSLTGLPAVRVAIYDTLRSEQLRFILLGSAASFLLAWLLLRNLAAAAIASAGPVLGTLWTLGGLGLAGIEVNILNSVLPTLVLVIGFADSVHLVVDIRASRRAGKPPREAAVEAVRHLAPACALTSLTTAVGFASLAATDIPIIRLFGLSCAAATLVAFAAVVLVVPLLAAGALGRRIGATRPMERAPRPMRGLGAIARKAIAHPRAVAGLGLALTAALATSALRLEPDSSLAESLPEPSEIRAALARFDEKLDGVLPAFAWMRWSAELDLSSVRSALAEARNAMCGHPGISPPISALEVQSLIGLVPGSPLGWAALDSLPAELRRRYWQPEERQALVAVRLRDRGAAAYEPVLAEIETELRAIEIRHPGVELELTGSSVVAGRNIRRMIRDLARSLALASIVIFAAMTLALRSLRLGAISVLPNILPLAATAAFTVWIGEPLRMTGVIVFCICLGIAVDDTIHFLMRFRRERARHADVQAALRATWNAVGVAIATTTGVLLVGFGILLASDLPPLRLFAVLSAVALLAAFLGDLLILPALLACFARKR